QTVVFVHGTPWSSKVFVPIAEALHKSFKFRVLLYDLGGYGQSQVCPNMTPIDPNGFVGETSVRTQGNILAALLAHLQMDGKESHTRPALIAHDIAGTIALRAHLLHGCEYSSLMLWDTNTILPWGDGFYKLVRANPNVFVEMPQNIFLAVVDAVTRSALCRGATTTGDVGRWVEALAAPWSVDHDAPGLVSGQSSFVRQIAQANDADVAEMLDQNLYSQVRCDVKILWGEEDQWIPRPKMDKLVELLGDRMKSFVPVPRAGHLIMIDQPELVTVEVVTWL
ncbi:hypothetical protein BAUCODRAFT_52312, partial [Baudoinia panamericana UAMH 10762]